MPAPRKFLTDVATRHQVFLERLKSQHANEFASVVDELNKETLRVVRALEVSNLSELGRRELKEILAELSQVNEDAIAAASKELFGNLDKLCSYELGFEARSFQFVPASVRLKSPEATDAFADALARPLSANGELLKPFVSKWGAGEVDRVNNVVRKAWGEGWPIDRLTSAINGTKRLGYKDGILGPPGASATVARRNARSVARTATQHVASSARMAFWERNANVISGYRFLATLDNRTTATCRSLDRRIFELNAGPVPPLHIGCRSTTVAEVDPSLDFLDEGATRASIDGPVEADLSYYDWLKSQPAAFQNEALGSTRAKLFRNGGLSSEDFAALNIGRNFEPMTLEQMRKLDPLAFENAGL